MKLKYSDNFAIERFISLLLPSLSSKERFALQLLGSLSIFVYRKLPFGCIQAESFPEYHPVFMQGYFAFMKSASRNTSSGSPSPPIKQTDRKSTRLNSSHQI